MNGRKSFDPSNTKPFNINIYYNINSKNITNNHQVQSHPVTSRPKNIQNNGNEDSFVNSRGEGKLKGNIKGNRKKFSADLGVPSDQKTQKIGKKSNNNSICSGYPSQTNNRKDNDKAEVDRKSSIHNPIEKNEKKLKQLLQIFSEGKIDKAKLTKQIINMFEMKAKNHMHDEIKERRITKKKRSQSTLIGTVTPKNQFSLLNSQATQNLKLIHKNRKKQSKSQRGSYTNSNKEIVKKQLLQKIIEYKCVNSSLFLQPEEEDHPIVKIDRTNDVQTSYSIVLLNENLKKQRENHIRVEENKKLEDKMAIKIQRAWRKYKTNTLINELILKSKEIAMKTDPNSIIQKMECVSEDHEQDAQNKFLSQQLSRNKVIKQSETARVQQLRDHELRKWNEIMDFVKLNIENKQISSEDCLTQIISYFENAKKTVENELKLEQITKFDKKLEGSREMTEFTNKEFSKEMMKEIEEVNQIDQSQNLEEKSEENDSALLDRNQDERFSDKEEDSLTQKLKCEADEQDIEIDSQKIIEFSSHELERIMKKSENMSFQVVQSALLKYSKKLDTEYYKNLDSLDLYQPTYPQSKLKLQQKYQQSKKQLRRILNNLNKGYIEAKKILQKQFMLSYDEQNLNSSSSKNSLHKCKSDNYLLKTAINYKSYIEKKEINTKKKSNESQSDQIQKFLKKSRNEENLENANKSEESEKGKIKIKQKAQRQKQQQQEVEQVIIRKGTKIFNTAKIQGRQPLIQNDKQLKFNKLDDKTFSQQLIQYQQYTKKYNESDDEHSSIFEKQIYEEISLVENTKINEMNRKLKNLSADEKEDIFQFLFIDLTLELITQYDNATPLYRTIKRYVEKQKKLESIPKGIKTSLQAVKDYLNSLAKLIHTNYLNVFEKNIVLPLGPTAKQMLKFMREEEQYDQDLEPNQDSGGLLILPVRIFEDLQSKIVTNYPPFFEDQAKQQTRLKLLKNMEHVHHKAIFDCLNEYLDLERPYGMWGIPFPWKTTHKNNRNFEWQAEKKAYKLNIGMEQVVQCCSFMCGILVDKQQSVFANYKVSENYVQQVRQDRMSKMLAKELTQNQERWSFFDDEETQILIQVAKFTMKTLIEEIIEDLNNFSQNEI